VRRRRFYRYRTGLLLRAGAVVQLWEEQAEPSSDQGQQAATNAGVQMLLGITR
jgi:hypothetical protein